MDQVKRDSNPRRDFEPHTVGIVEELLDYVGVSPGLTLVGVGTLLILLGAYISLRDWNKKREGLTAVQKRGSEW